MKRMPVLSSVTYEIKSQYFDRSRVSVFFYFNEYHVQHNYTSTTNRPVLRLYEYKKSNHANNVVLGLA